MKTLPFTLSSHAVTVTTNRGITHEWISATLAQPARVEADQTDATLRHALKIIPEFGGRVLRVVYNPSHTPWLIVTAYFDRKVKDRL